MATANNLYSRFVVWAKIILPLIALAILSSLFLFSKNYDPSLGIRYSDEDLRQIAEREGISNPRLAGTTAEGISISLSATDAKPGTGSDISVKANNMRAKIESPDGDTLQIVAKTGFMNNDATAGELSGGIFLETSFGYTAVAEGIRFNLEAFQIHSIGAIAATSPFGDISAGEMLVSFDEADDSSESGGYVLVFQKGVMLVYTPQTEDQE